MENEKEEIVKQDSAEQGAAEQLDKNGQKDEKFPWKRREESFVMKPLGIL